MLSNSKYQNLQYPKNRVQNRLLKRAVLYRRNQVLLDLKADYYYHLSQEKLKTYMNSLKRSPKVKTKLQSSVPTFYRSISNLLNLDQLNHTDHCKDHFYYQ